MKHIADAVEGTGGSGGYARLASERLAPQAEIARSTRALLKNALGAHRDGLDTYPSLRSLNEIIGTQYGDRVIFELLQNAHDAHDPAEKGDVSIRLMIGSEQSGHLLVANKGHPFSKENLKAICNIGRSNKQIGEGIGNKGLGFRSVEALTDDVHIFSADPSARGSLFEGFCFRFASANEVVGLLEGIGASTEESAALAQDIPRYLVPVALQEQPADVRELAAAGYATVVRLPLTSARAVALAEAQVATLMEGTAPVQLFLDRLAALEVLIDRVGIPRKRSALTRKVEQISSTLLPTSVRMAWVTLEAGKKFLVIRQTMPKAEVIKAVEDSIDAAPPLKRWRDWKGDAVVSVAVRIDQPAGLTPRLYNFLPMDAYAVAPFAGYLDAPFFADIDRRAIKPDLPLNRYLVEAAANTVARAALAIVEEALPIASSALIDITAWGAPHMGTISAAFIALKHPLADAKVWPINPAGGTRWASFRTLYSLPACKAKQFTAPRLAKVAGAHILWGVEDEARLARIRSLAQAELLSLTPSQDSLCGWAEAIALDLAAQRKMSLGAWRDFYNDIVALFAEVRISLGSLVGRKLFLSNEEKLLVATAKGLEDAPPVFARSVVERGKRGEGPPQPPAAVARKFRFLNPKVSISDEVIQKFEKAGLLRRYDPLEALAGLKGILGASATEIQKREALTWAHRVWQTSPAKAAEPALKEAGLSVPCVGGWIETKQAHFSGAWTDLGKTLETYLVLAAPLSADCKAQRDRLLVGFQEWPKARTDDRKDDWTHFLRVLGVRDGLVPIPATLRRKGTPTGYWNWLLGVGDGQHGLDKTWVSQAGTFYLQKPQTDYVLAGELWRLPGQLEHSLLPEAAKVALSDLLVVYLKGGSVTHLSFSIGPWNGQTTHSFPTPLQVFLRTASWTASYRRDELVFLAPNQTWASTAPRSPPPRFVARFRSEAGGREELPQLLFGQHVGLRDWVDPANAPRRLASLAATLTDLFPNERRDFRDQLRRAWSDVVEHRVELPDFVELVVERRAAMELCAPNAQTPPAVYVTNEAQGLAARSLADEGLPVLDVGETDASVVREMLAATRAFAPSLADSSEVQLLVDGKPLELSANDPLLVAGELSWLSDVAVLGRQHAGGDPLELRNVSGEEVDRRIRQIRVRRCTRFDLIIAGKTLAVRSHERVHAVSHSKNPTLIIEGTGSLDVRMLLAASQAITKLLGARRNTLETILGRLEREGFTGSTSGPTEEQLARAIFRDVDIVREHFSATHGGMKSLVDALLPVVAHLKGRAAADDLQERHSQLGPSMQLRHCLIQDLGLEEGKADELLLLVGETTDQKKICLQLGFGFTEYGHTLAELGYQPMNDEVDFRRLFEAYRNELLPELRDRLRRRFYPVWKEGGDLSLYVVLRTLEFIAFDPAWPAELQEISLAFLTSHAAAAMDVAVGSDNPDIKLQPHEEVTDANRRAVISRHARLSSVVRAWCRKQGGGRASPMEPFDPHATVRGLDRVGLLDFGIVKGASLLALLQRIDAWPLDMPLSEDLSELGLTEDDLRHEEAEAKETRHKIEIQRRTVEFSGTSLDVGSPDFSEQFERLANASLLQGDGWLERSRMVRLSPQEQGDQSRNRRRPSGGGGGRGNTGWANQPPEAIFRAMGVSSEWLARKYLMQQYPKHMSDECWVSSNRTHFCTGSAGDDSLGYDFRVVTDRREFLFEVKSSLNEGGEFELTARELEIAGSAREDQKRRYRILYVPFVFDPNKWGVWVLPNPAGTKTRDRFRVVRSGSVRYGFEPP